MAGQGSGATAALDPTDTRAIDRRIVALAVPAVGALVADPLLGVVDTAVAGRVSTVALGALGLGTALLAAGTWLFNFLVFGTTSAVARAVGQDRRHRATERIGHAAVVALVLGILVAVAVATLATPLVRAMGAVDELVAPAATYLRVRAVGVPFLLLGMVGHGAFRGVGDTRTPLLVVVVANLVNAGLDIALVVFGTAGLPGIAWATVAAEVLVVVLFVALSGRSGLDPRLVVPDRRELAELVRVSRDIVLRTGGLLLGLLLVASAAARIDAATAAAHQVLYQVFILAALAQDSIAVAGQTLVGAALGRGDDATVLAVTRRLLRWGLGLGVATAAGVAALGGVLPALLTDDPATLSVVAGAWLVGALVHLPGGLAFVLDGVLMGADDWAYLRTWTAAAAVSGGLAAQLAAAGGAGLVVLWWCVVGLMVGRAVALLLRVRGRAWVDDALMRG